MAAIGWVTLAAMARHVDQAALPADRGTGSKRRFPHPTWLTLFCLTRNEDWLFRGAEGRPNTQRCAWPWGCGRCPTTPLSTPCPAQRAEAALDQALQAVVQRLARHPGNQATVIDD